MKFNSEFGMRFLSSICWVYFTANGQYTDASQLHPNDVSYMLSKINMKVMLPKCSKIQRKEDIVIKCIWIFSTVFDMRVLCAMKRRYFFVVSWIHSSVL